MKAKSVSSITPEDTPGLDRIEYFMAMGLAEEEGISLIDARSRVREVMERIKWAGFAQDFVEACPFSSEYFDNLGVPRVIEAAPFPKRSKWMETRRRIIRDLRELVASWDREG